MGMATKTSHSTTSGTPTVLPATVIVPSKQW
jgi:hypothetical protein